MQRDDGKEVAQKLNSRLGAGENQNSTRFLYATVTSVAPWGIRTEDGVPFTNEFIHVSPFVNVPAPTTKTLIHNHDGEVKDDHKPNVALWEDIKVGDTVAVLNTNDAQLCVLLWKVKDGGGVI